MRTGPERWRSYFGYNSHIGRIPLWGTGPRAAAWQAATLFLLAGVLALVGIAGDPGRAGNLLVVAACDIAVALTGLLWPWHRTARHAPAVLGVLGFAVLGISTWAFGGVAAGTGPFLVLLYAWAGLHFPRWILYAFGPPATAAYLVPLLVTGQSPTVVSSALVLLPVALAVALLIEAQARYLRDDRERLARIEQWRAAMVNTLAHDVRSPLTVVQIVLEEIQDAATTGRAGQQIGMALRQTARLSRLAEGLLDAHRIDSTGRLALDRRRHPARQLVQDALSYAGASGVTVDVDEHLTIDVDQQRFEQIVINLVGNAVKYGAAPIVVRITRDDGADRLEVRDHGPGIPEALRARLFSEFAAGGRTGVGLGLWIVRRLAEAHGGRVVAEPRDPGVAMVVTLPAPP